MIYEQWSLSLSSYILIECLYCEIYNSDTETLVGLPRPIHESVKTLKQVWNAKY